MAVEKERIDLFMRLPTWSAGDAVRLLLEIDPDSIQLDDDLDGTDLETEVRALINWLFRYGVLPRALLEPTDASPELVVDYLRSMEGVRLAPAEWLAAAAANPGAPAEWLESLSSPSRTPEKAETHARRWGVTKREILSVDWPMPNNAPKLVNILDELPKWADAACRKIGSRGKGANGSHLWNPAILAFCLSIKTPQKKWAIGEGALTNFLRLHFSDYLLDWEIATGKDA